MSVFSILHIKKDNKNRSKISLFMASSAVIYKIPSSAGTTKTLEWASKSNLKARHGVSCL